MHKATIRFRECFNKLPDDIQKIAKKNFDLLKSGYFHPSLDFKKVGSFWSVRIGSNYRALAIKDKNNFIWVWTGNYDDYNRLISKH